MKVQSFTYNPFMTNCYVCYDAGEAVVIDPSCASAEEKDEVTQFLESNDLTVKHLLLTHAHIDHIFGCAFFEARYDDEFKMHEASIPFIERSVDQAKAFGVEVDPPSVPDTFLEEGDTISFGTVTLDVLHTPGHSPDSICFVDRDSDQAVTGDVLFQDSIGRTEGLPQTSMPQLMASIRDKILPLGDAFTIYPGHGPKTTVARERRQNPFLNDI
ncbi:MBL fold metallo-hydrolase [Longibacter salinarum]|uniref:MBL fold metallo-hydrolase n=1 Tax=Longibacter salinarum TaxID=1850348 RepID=A0A2A8D070_9BACT|nr:MBL fold metallo-hydrolase [Longibacter salinarum]PEN14379.1 MBL fold metallo-hydrolase [Longibacter salinarum]